MCRDTVFKPNVSARFHRIWSHSIQFLEIPQDSVEFNSTRFNSTRFSSTRFNFASFNWNSNWISQFIRGLVERPFSAKRVSCNLQAASATCVMENDFLGNFQSLKFRRNCVALKSQNFRCKFRSPKFSSSKFARESEVSRLRSSKNSKINDRPFLRSRVR